jgi:hypothetical protein
MGVERGHLLPEKVAAVNQSGVAVTPASVI